MGQFLSNIALAIKSIFLIISNLQAGIEQILYMLPKASQFLIYSISQMPPVLTAFATAFIGVSVVYLIVGR